MELAEFFDGLLDLGSGSGEVAMGPPIVEHRALLQLLAENGQGLLRGIAIVGKRGVVHGRIGEQGKQAAFVSRSGKLNVLLQLRYQFLEFGQQAGILL